MRNRQTIKTLILVCEGASEKMLLVGYLKKSLHKHITGIKPTLKSENLGGISSLPELKRKYEDQKKKYTRMPGERDYSFIFIFDDDVEQSISMKEYIEEKGHQVIQLSPNIEGFLLKLIGKPIAGNNKTELFRKECKQKFKKEFGCDAHKMKTKDWNEIFGVDCCKINELLQKDATLLQLVTIIKGD